jgi:ribonucleoside-diphosphate reductase alpha chain
MIREFPNLKFDFLRCVTSTSIAPTGTLTLMFRHMPLSYGVESGFGIYLWKRTRISGKYEYYFVVPHIVRKIYKDAGYEIPIKSDAIKDTWDGENGKPIAKFIDENRDNVGIKFKHSSEISAYDKLDLMSKLMEWVDSSISVTYMLPEDTTTKKVYDFILKAHEKGIKSIAAFPDKKMYGIISLIPFKELALKLKSEGIEIHPQNFDENELNELHISNDFILATSSPKRPKSLPADVYCVTVKGEKFIVALGLLNGAPYEIFCGKMNGLNFKFNHKEGVIEKIKRGQYSLLIGEDIEVEDFSGYFRPVEAELFRMVSTSLRHGVPIKFIVEQLSKSAEDISSLTSAAARTLKKYIKNGEIVTGVRCPNCEGEVIYDETGCNKCTVCDWSKCN